MSSNKLIRVGLFGAAPDTPNMGVSALFMSTLDALIHRISNIEFVVFDNQLGKRQGSILLPSGREISVIYFGARGGKRLYRQECLATMSALSRLGQVGGWLNQGIRLIDSCDAMIDISGGDSFSDIYGLKRFNAILRPKNIAVRRKVPLILMPQTYGPYRSPSAKNQAREAIKTASMTWSRDEESYQLIKDLLGSDFEPEKHFCGVDMAFVLQSKRPSVSLGSDIDSWLDTQDNESPTIGINISGLIYNNPEMAKHTYLFRADYQEIIHKLILEILSHTKAKILLVPHVLDKPGHYESDYGACLSVLNKLNQEYQSRVRILPPTLDQSEIKWVISRVQWFCGTRMHSTIASLSSGVPTAAISYSDKTRGVFHTCGQASQVFDPRTLEVNEIVLGLLSGYSERQQTKDSIALTLPSVLSIAASQMDTIADFIRLCHAEKKSH